MAMSKTQPASPWRRLAGRGAESFASPPRLRVCSLCCVSPSCGSLSHLCWDGFVLFPGVSPPAGQQHTNTESQHKPPVCVRVCLQVCVSLQVCVLLMVCVCVCVRRPERSQPVRLQLEECLSAQQVPTAELVQGYVKKVPPLHI